MSRVSSRNAPTIPSFGAWVTKCGPGSTTDGNSKLWVAACLLVGAALVAAGFALPMFRPPREPGGAWMVTALLSGAGVVTVLSGVGIAALLWMERTTEVHLFENGIAKRRANQLQTAEWRQIVLVTFNEFYASRFAEPSYEVTVKKLGGETITFSTTLRGNSQAVFDALTANVENKQFIEAASD